MRRHHAEFPDRSAAPRLHLADVRVKVAVHNGSSWSTTNYDVPAGGPRVGFEVPEGTTKLSLGRVKKSATDVVDNAPVGWLLESQA